MKFKDWIQVVLFMGGLVLFIGGVIEVVYFKNLTLGWKLSASASILCGTSTAIFFITKFIKSFKKKKMA